MKKQKPMMLYVDAKMPCIRRGNTAMGYQDIKFKVEYDKAGRQLSNKIAEILKDPEAWYLRFLIGTFYHELGTPKDDSLVAFTIEDFAKLNDLSVEKAQRKLADCLEAMNSLLSITWQKKRNYKTDTGRLNATITQFSFGGVIFEEINPSIVKYLKKYRDVFEPVVADVKKLPQQDLIVADAQAMYDKAMSHLVQGLTDDLPF